MLRQVCLDCQIIAFHKCLMNEMSTCELLFKILKEQRARNVMGSSTICNFLVDVAFIAKCQVLGRRNKCFEPRYIIV